jgi:uncharacterized Rmd1/YagE family protein
MECYAYCTASLYQVKPLFDDLKSRHKATLYRDVIHLELSEGNLFLFPYGAAVFWGISKELNPLILEQIAAFEVESLEECEADEFGYSYGDSAKVVEDEITLPNMEMLTKLAISHGIAQSVKLNSFETRMFKTFNNTRKIPEDLAKKGNISLSRNAIRKQMGALFIERATITLHVDALDLPEFFWEYPELEPYYRMITNYLDVQTRVEVLNKRLTIIHDLYEVLGNELNQQHSSRLEMTIIILIVLEVIISLLRDVFRVI